MLDHRELPEAQWRERARAHADRLAPYLEPHLARREQHRKHPVHDFMFTYYSHPPARLRRWHPGYGVRLAAAAGEYGGGRGYLVTGTTASVDPAYLVRQRELIGSIGRLLAATASRPGNFGCFGLHEWAMVYHLGQQQVRHAAWPLRLGRAGTDAVVEAHRIGCSHFDAYRFFTPDAVPLNTLRPGAGDRADFEQPACLHATMDLYKHAFRLSPLIGSDLVADCFELAWAVRVVDMRASPYDLGDLGMAPIPIETPEGKQEYRAAQRRFAERAAPLRAALLAACTDLLGVGSSGAR